MRTPHKLQQGMTVLGMLFTVIVVASVLLLTVKMVPLYIDDYAIGKALTALEDEQLPVSSTKRAIREKLRRKLTADYTRDLTDEEIQVTKIKDGVIIDIVYEARVELVANIDLVAKFAHHLEKKK